MAGEAAEGYHGRRARHVLRRVGDSLRKRSTILVAVVRDGKSHVNSPADFVVQDGDEALVIAESIESLTPVEQPA